MKKFNINNLVRIKLTDDGLKMLEAKHNELLKQLPTDLAKEIGKYVPKIDENGYMEMQLWEVMHTFGPKMYNGSPNLLFETDIEIDENELVDINNNHKIK